MQGDNDIMKQYESGYNICRICKKWFSYGVWVSKYDLKIPSVCESCDAIINKLKEEERVCGTDKIK